MRKNSFSWGNNWWNSIRTNQYFNIYNTNTESEQPETLSNLVSILEKVKDIQNKNIVCLARWLSVHLRTKWFWVRVQLQSFNVIFDISLESLGEIQCLKKKSIEKLIQILERINLCGTWRVRNSKIKRFTFWQQYTSGFIQRRFEYFFVSNVLQESVNKTDVLAAFPTDH